MAPKKDPTANIVQYKDRQGRVHWASRTAPDVVKGIDSGQFTVVEEVAPDAPTVPANTDGPNPGPVK